MLIVATAMSACSEQARDPIANSADAEGDAGLAAMDAAAAAMENAAAQMNAAADQLAGTGTTGRWHYDEDEDKVRGVKRQFATNTSLNTIRQDFPYDGDTSMRLMLRKDGRGTDAMFIVSSGQMMCPSYEGCSGTIRFDDKPPEKISFSGPSDNSNETVFVDNTRWFLSNLRSAKKMVLEKTLYGAGDQQFEFDVSGLDWGG